MESSRKLTSADRVHYAIKSLLDEHLKLEQKIVVAYSGGVDSTVLLHALSAYRQQVYFPLEAIHFHHGLSCSADAWVEHCESICDQQGVPLHLCYLSVPSDSGQGIEAAARHLRYSELDRVDATWVALGHHAGDQAETLLLNLCRGTGVLGMCGMRAREGRYLRPFLLLERAELADYAKSHALSWCEDDSNQSRRFTRNFIRHDVLPLLTERFPSLAKSLSNASLHFGKAQSLLNALAVIDAEGVEMAFPFPTRVVEKLSEDRAANLMRCLLTSTSLQSPPSIRLLEFIRQLHSAAPDRHPELRLGSISIIRQRRHLVLHHLKSPREQLG